MFTIMMDGTTEKTGHELIGIVARYIDADTGEIAEHVIDVKDGTDDKSAKGLLKLLNSTLDEADLSTDGVVSQTYRLNSQNEKSLPDIGTLFFVSQSLQFSSIIWSCCLGEC